MAARAVGPGGLTAFVPNGESRQETAIVLVGTARENGLSPRSIRTTASGFYISDELADLLGQDDTEEVVSGNDEETDDTYDPADYTVAQVKEFVSEHPDLALDVLDSERAGEDRATLTKWLTEFSDDETSGNRAAKNDGTDKE